MIDCGYIILDKCPLGVLSYRIEKKDSDFFVVKNLKALPKKKYPSRWASLSSVKNVLNDGNSRIINGGVNHGVYLSRTLMFDFFLWAINNEMESDMLSRLSDDLGNPRRIKILHSRVEIEFGENIINNLFSDYEVISQFPVFNGKYFIDWYIPELNIAIEYDEYYHKNNKKADNERQEEIEKELGCRFLRYKE